ncbi:tubby C-terminal domain-like protein [Pallidibacillus thermolactis]|uniref:tubby C-terminal domain-like protein n=1 Tax=Pallidibacillus thermolactis TaxID=251051 RepID=UPI00406BCEB9
MSTKTKYFNVYLKSTLYRSIWSGEIRGKDVYEIKDKTKISTNLQLECIYSENERLIIKKDFGDHRIFVVNGNESLVADIKLTRVIPPLEVKAKIYSHEERF